MLGFASSLRASCYNSAVDSSLRTVPRCYAFLAGLAICAAGPVACEKSDTRPTPPVQETHGPVDSIGGAFSCKIDSGHVYCKGVDTYCQLGQGAPGPRLASWVELPSISDARALALGNAHACALRAAGQVSCWGWNLHGEAKPPRPAVPDPNVHANDPSLTVGTPLDVGGISDAVEVAASTSSTCARTASGAVFCWGDSLFVDADDDGALRQVSVPESIALAAGDDFVCSISSDRRVFCWGFVLDTRGDGHTAHSPSMVLTPGAKEPIKSGRYGVCVGTGSKRRCWGRPPGSVRLTRPR